MALSREFAREHIARWEALLTLPYYPHREKWPKRLFHHAPLENAVEILRSGQLCSRADPNNRRQIDVAGAGVIDARFDAHAYSRLYFRPRTPTQFHIEGIRKPEECRFGQAAHAPVLIMFVFDAMSVLTLPNTRFSDRNMQLPGTEIWDSEAQFSQIPFDKVYSEGGIAGDRSIIEHRCAEVLAESPLLLPDTLRWIYCRSEAERAYLTHALGVDSAPWAGQIVVSDDLRVFQKQYAFVEDVIAGADGVKFKLSPRSDLRPLSLEMSVLDADRREVVRLDNDQFPATPQNAQRWILQANLADGFYLVTIKLEGHVAYEAWHSVGDVLF